jgi:TRAP-type mannitol/chloroaromatic compound transport system permease small subunit
MNRFLVGIDRISAGVGKTFGWIIVVLTLGAAYEVFVASRAMSGVVGWVCRTVGASCTGTVPTSWAYDFSYIMYGMLLLMTGAYTLSRNGHVRADFLYRRWRPRVQAAVDLVLYFIFFLPAVLALIYSGIPFAEYSWRFKEKSIFSPAGIPVYPLKVLIPIAAAFLLVQGIAEIIRCFVCVRTGVWPQRLADVEELETAILHERQRMEEIEAERAKRGGAGA